ncbi:hypothetical protein ACTZWW_04385 [Salinarimonas sp. NSM]|uniref:hypothetical protein n=1 Tax=Salinarimonas sp. NSM TaxID=3458003 RepID=UPI00403616B8
MPRLTLTNVTLGDGRGPALRAVEATVSAGRVCAIAISREHFHCGTVVGFHQLDPHSSPRLYACIAAAVMREAGDRIGA